MINDPLLTTFKQHLLEVARHWEAPKAPAFGGYIAPELPYGPELLSGLSQSDDGFRLLGSLDLRMEMYLPPFPAKPYYEHQIPARSDPDSDFYDRGVHRGNDDW
jgi:hypothetical protein